MTDIAFADAFILEEIVTEPPSRVSGASASDPRMMWLVEPARVQATIKYSGTMSHPSDTRGKTAATIAAFAHFAFVYSHKTLIFADIQGNGSQLNKHKMLLYNAMIFRNTFERERTERGDLVRPHDTFN